VALMVRWERRLALVCAVVGVILLLTTISFVLVDGQLSQRSAFVLFAGLALVIVYGVVQPSAVADLVRSRRARFGSLSVLISAVVIGILVAVNVLASRSTQAADLTQSGANTLAPRSVQVARQLDSDLTVTGFFRPDETDTRRGVQALLDLYRQQSPHVKVRFLDPDQNAAQARNLGVTIAGSIVLQYRSRPPIVLNLAEQSESDVTGAILRLESAHSPNLCWAAGEGERNLQDVDQVNGYSAASDLIKSSNYRVQEVLLSQQGVPAGCDVLVVAELQRPLNDFAVKAIQDYLGRGGKLLLAVDPWIDARTLGSANAVVKPLGVAFDGGLVIEPDPAHAAKDDRTVPIVDRFGGSPITRDLANRYVFFPESTAITGTAATGVTSTNVAATSDRSYDILQQRTSLDQRQIDKKGPFTLMRSLEQPVAGGRTARVVLVGTSSLAENRTMPPAAAGSNPDLLVATLDWLSQQDALIAISPKPPAAQPLALTQQDVTVNEVVTVGLLPLALLAIGILVLVRRRRSTVARA
jgi:ABC-type uncharacterized transport system involved in gliding motility auxiliary subunit